MWGIGKLEERTGLGNEDKAKHPGDECQYAVIMHNRTWMTG